MGSETLQCVFEIVQWLLKLCNAFSKSFNGFPELFNAIAMASKDFFKSDFVCFDIHGAVSPGPDVLRMQR